MEKNCTKISKVYLEDSVLLLMSEMDEEFDIDTVFTWNVDKFSRLKQKIFYTKCVSSFTRWWIFRLLKYKRALFLTLHTNELSKNVLFQFITKDSRRTCVQSQEIQDGLYVGEYSLDLLQKLNNNILSDDILRIRCSYTCRPKNFHNAVIEYDSRKKEVDADILSKNIKELYLRALHCDFVIRVRDDEFPVHKLILECRSGFFYKLFEKVGYNSSSEERFDTLPVIMNVVLLYIYTGELTYMEVEDMIMVFKVAQEMEIHSLICRCIDYFKEHLTEDTVQDIFYIAKEYTVVVLELAVIHFAMEKNLQHTDLWTEIQKKYKLTYEKAKVT